MKKMFLNSVFILLISLTIVYSFPCPRECICKPTDNTNGVDYKRMSYLMDCTNISLSNDKLIYQAENWTINEDKIDDGDNDAINDYVISIDLSNSLSLKKFTHKTIQLSGFSFEIRSLSLTNQTNDFTFKPNSFNSSIYRNLRILNLSSCCKQMPEECQQLFRPLTSLEVLDLSGSDMYKTCLNTSGMLSQLT